MSSSRGYMQVFRTLGVTGLIAAIAATVTVAAFASEQARTAAPHSHGSAALVSDKASDLRVTLNRLLGEHALLAVSATQAGYSGSKTFPALGAALDKNSVAVSAAIGSVFGQAAGSQFLNGKLLWRDHIRFFVAYTVALAKKDKAGQNKAVGNLMGYVEAFSSFLSKATGLPQSALRTSIRSHVMQLKGSLDAYAAGNYTQSYTLARTAYHHMGMTGDVLAAAIVKKFPAQF